MSQLGSYARRIMNRRQTIRRERMPQPVLRPSRKTGRFAHAIQFSTRAVWHYQAHRATVNAQPRREIRLYRNKSASGTLCLCRLHFDMSTREINLAPLITAMVDIAAQFDTS